MEDIEYTLYDMNKQLVSQEEPIDETKLRNELTNIGCWFSSKLNKNFMLLCHERRDYTIFYLKSKNFSKAVEELESVLTNRGTIMDVHFQHEQKIYEIWIKTNDKSDNPAEDIYMYYLFPCDDFIIKV